MVSANIEVFLILGRPVAVPGEDLVALEAEGGGRVAGVARRVGKQAHGVGQG